MGTAQGRDKIAVVGLGPLGLVTLKNLIEQGFEVTGYDQTDVVGGLWNFRDDDQTTVLESTVSNVSKQRGCFTDYPFPSNTPTYPRAHEIKQYLCDYTKHFALEKYIELESEVTKVIRDDELESWSLHIVRNNKLEIKVFDKLVLATGINKQPFLPKIEGLDCFKGQILHSGSYKRPVALKDKTVLIVGLSNSAVDTAASLVGYAKHVYISRRHDAFLFPRMLNDKPIDHAFTHRKDIIMTTMRSYFPSFSDKMMRKGLSNMTRKGFAEIPCNWDLASAPLPSRTPPIISDNIFSEIVKGNVTLVPKIKTISDGNMILFENDESLEIDSIIFCTGYRADYSLVGEYDPTLEQTEAWKAATGSNGRCLPNLYRNIFSLKLPHSLAFMGAIAYLSPAFQLYDLASMALARIWAKQFDLPSDIEMAMQVRKQQEWLISLAAEGTVITGWVNGSEWLAWADMAAGSDLLPHLSYSIQGWQFWIQDKKLCNALMDGIPSPHAFRLFETGKRAAWNGARDEILRINSQATKGE